MFSNDEWNENQWSHKQDGKDLKNKANEEIFWKKAAEIVKVVEPLVKVLLLVDGELLAMGFIYEAMEQVKEKIKTTYKDILAKYGRIWAIIDERWNNQLHRPIHAARYFFNPRYHYKALKAVSLGGEVRDGLIDYIDRMIPLESDQLEIHRQVTCFSNATGTFGKNLAKIAREVDEPSWVVESHPTEFDSNEDPDLDLHMEASLKQNVQLNADPLVPTSTSAPSPPVAGASSAQPQRKRISRLYQRAITAQPASATISTVAVEDDEEEEPWVSLFESDSESEPDDVGSSSSSQ
eukprot:PITA_34141